MLYVPTHLSFQFPKLESLPLASHTMDGYRPGPRRSQSHRPVRLVHREVLNMSKNGLKWPGGWAESLTWSGTGDADIQQVYSSSFAQCTWPSIKGPELRPSADCPQATLRPWVTFGERGLSLSEVSRAKICNDQSCKTVLIYLIYLKAVSRISTEVQANKRLLCAEL